MLIGISGKMGTGKTTLANELIALRGGKRISFADALRGEVNREFGIPIEWLKCPVRKVESSYRFGMYRKSIRELLQWWGVMRRESDPNYWVNRTMVEIGRLKASLPAGQLIVIDDVRFRNEARLIDSMGGLMIRLDPYPEWQLKAGSGHSSEIDLDAYQGFDIRRSPGFGTLPFVAVGVLEELGGTI